MDNVVIRPATTDDFKTVQSLIRSMDEFHHRNSPERIKPAEDALLTYDVFRSYLADQRQSLFVAVKDDVVRAYIRGQLIEQSDGRAHHARRIVLVHEVVVDASFREQGIGRKFFEHTEHWARTNGAESIELAVYQFNDAALQFYRSLGFENLLVRVSRAVQ